MLIIWRSLWVCLMLIPAFVSTGCLYDNPRDTEAEELLSLLTPSATTEAATCTLSGNVLTVRATDSSAFSRCALASGTLIASNDVSTWDLRFQRFKIATNSGTSGSGSGGACKTGSTNFSAITSVSALAGGSQPDCPHFAVDSTQTTTAGGGSGVSYSGASVLVDWYDYNETTHVLSAKSDVYIIRSGNGTKYYKIQMLDYYSSAGVAGYPQLRREEIPF